MTELGWTVVRVRDLTRGGYKEQVREYVREAPNARALRQVTSKSVSVDASKPELVTKAPTALLYRRLLQQSCRKLRLRQTPRLDFPHQFQRRLSQATA
jgi:hypothetical protein